MCTIIDENDDATVGGGLLYSAARFELRDASARRDSSTDTVASQKPSGW